MTDLTRARLAELRAFAENDTVGHHLHTWIEPSEVLALIAQCEAGLPASGGVSGESSLLSQLQSAGRRNEHQAAELDASNAALADALGLLRELDATNGYDAEQARGFRTRLTDFLAKHGPSP